MLTKEVWNKIKQILQGRRTPETLIIKVTEESLAKARSLGYGHMTDPQRCVLATALRLQRPRSRVVVLYPAAYLDGQWYLPGNPSHFREYQRVYSNSPSVVGPVEFDLHAVPDDHPRLLDSYDVRYMRGRMEADDFWEPLAPDG